MIAMNHSELDDVPYWRDHYSRATENSRPIEGPSRFAEFVLDHMSRAAAVIDFGCGDGRDALYFASSGRQVIGIDAARPALDRLSRAAECRGLNVVALAADLRNVADIQRIRDAIARECRSGTRNIYARFFLHAIREPTRRLFFDLARELLIDGRGELLVEFRGAQDAATHHHFGEDHHRDYLDEERVRSQLEELGASITYSASGKGFAPYNGEDPWIVRIACEWRGSGLAVDSG
jgi:SAM-dependent methyltransferase